MGGGEKGCEGSLWGPGLEPGQWAESRPLGNVPPQPPTDRNLSPPSAIPSAPQAVISSVNETSLMLEWTPPRDSGGREDLVYNIICKSCGSGRGACTRCGDNVQYAPRQLGLTEPRIYISDLLAHTQYTFEIQAVNGVTDQSPFSPQFASVNITTNQAGKHFKCTLRGQGRARLCKPVSRQPSSKTLSPLWSGFCFSKAVLTWEGKRLPVRCHGVHNNRCRLVNVCR